jgi:outer membrane protein TolC
LLEAYKLKKEEVSTLEKSMENIELLFTTNRVDYIEVQLLQQNILKAKLELQNLQNRQNQVALNLFKSLGGGQ